MEYEAQRLLAVSAVRSAAAVCVKVQKDLVTAQTLAKRDKSPVTVADFAAQAVVCAALAEGMGEGVRIVGEEDAAELREPGQAGLLAAVAGHAGMSEAAALAAIDLGGFDPLAGGSEASAAPQSRRGVGGGGRAGETSGGGYWALDPIDGTKGFLRGEQYAVALALIEKGEVVLGVLGCPNFEGGLLLVAVRGQGAQRLALSGEAMAGEAVRVSGVAESSSARLCESVESGHSDHGASSRIAKALGITQEPYRIDSQCKYAALAMGKAEVYLRLPTRPGYCEKIWDHAAGKLVVEEAGGVVTDVRGAALDFGKGRTLTADGGVVASNGKFHAAVVAAVK